MSIEESIQALTAAVVELTATLKAGTSQPPGGCCGEAKKPELKRIEEPELKKIEEPVTIGITAAPEEVTYADIVNVGLKLSASKGREAVKAVFEELGVKTAKDIKPEDYPTALAALEKANA